MTPPAMRKPIGMLPPSPRKIRAGRDEVEDEEHTARRREGQHQLGERPDLLDRREKADAEGCDRAGHGGRAVEVVHQVEGVDDADHPEHGHRDVDSRAGAELPVNAGCIERDRGKALRNEPRADRQAHPVVERPEGAQRQRDEKQGVVVRKRPAKGGGNENH